MKKIGFLSSLLGRVGWGLLLFICSTAFGQSSVYPVKNTPANYYPGINYNIPNATNLQTQLITGGVRITWIDSPIAGAITELWASVDTGKTWVLLGCFLKGIQTYDDICMGGVEINMQYKIRSFINGDIIMNCIAEAGALTKELGLSCLIGSTQSYINWGDGVQYFLSMNSTLTTLSHTYASANTYVITIIHAESVDKFLLGEVSSGSYLPSNSTAIGIHFDISQLNDAVNLTYLGIQGNADYTWTGSIDGISKKLTYLRFLTQSNHIIGDITPFTKLEDAFLMGRLHGNMSNTIPLAHLFFHGEITCTCDISNLVNLITIDSYGIYSFLSGDVTNLIKLTTICVGTPNEFYGDITNLPDYEYLDNQNSDSHLSHMTGNITNKTKLWKFRSYNTHNAFTGSIPNLTVLEMIAVNATDLSTVTKPTTIINNTILCFFDGRGWNFTSSEINQILADIKTNKDAPKRFPNQGARHFWLNSVGSEAPTGQGIIDKAYLQNYSSPTPPGTADKWTIDTN